MRWTAYLSHALAAGCGLLAGSLWPYIQSAGSSRPRAGQAVTLDLTLIEGQPYRVARIVDGDTLALDNGLMIRYLGVNTPEAGRWVKDEAPLCDAARARNQELTNGKRVSLIFGQEPVDPYGRVAARVCLWESVGLGVGFSYTGASEIPASTSAGSQTRDLGITASFDARQSARVPVLREHQRRGLSRGGPARGAGHSSGEFPRVLLARGSRGHRSGSKPSPATPLGTVLQMSFWNARIFMNQDATPERLVTCRGSRRRTCTTKVSVAP
jgi:hypothetical protein